jgi:hypothetical protein
MTWLLRRQFMDEGIDKSELYNNITSDIENINMDEGRL